MAAGVGNEAGGRARRGSEMRGLYGDGARTRLAGGSRSYVWASDGSVVTSSTQRTAVQFSSG
jgi:hypothetical protein